MNDGLRLPRWRSYSPILFGLMVAVALAGGIWGYALVETPDGQCLPWTDVLYGAIGLFFFEWALELGQRPPLVLEVARFLAPTLTATAALRALQGILAGHFEAKRRERLRGHRVVCGLDAHGRSVALAALAAGERVVVIDPDAVAEGDALAAHRHLFLVRGDPRQEATLRAAGAHRAGQVFLVLPSDSENLEGLLALRTLCLATAGPHVECFVRLAQLRLSDPILRHSFFADRKGRIEVTIFSEPLAAAQDLWDAMLAQGHERGRCLPLGLDEAAPAHVFLLGAGSLVPAIGRQLARLAHFAGEGPTRLSAFAEDYDPAQGGDRSAVLLPGVEAVLDVHTAPLPPLAPATLEAIATASRAGERITVVASLDDPTANLHLALQLNARLRAEVAPDIPIFVYLRDAPGIAEILRGEARAEEELCNVFAFGDLRRILSVEAIKRERINRMARWTHHQYSQKGHLHTDAAALADWAALPEDLKESNRAVAEHIRVKCLLLGVDILAGGSPAPAQVEAALETLARTEHRRWMADKLLQGWTPGPRTDRARRIHQNLVPWEELSEEEREKDRTQVRAIAAILHDCPPA